MRSTQFIDGYRFAMKQAIEFLHQRAREMNDPKAAMIINATAHSLGVKKSEFMKSAGVVNNEMENAK
jgi:hypothetical protein